MIELLKPSAYSVGTIRNPGHPDHGKPALYIPAGSPDAAALDVAFAKLGAERAAARQALLTNEAPRGTVAHVQRRVSIAAVLARENVASQETVSPRQKAALGRLMLEKDVLFGLPHASLPDAVDYLTECVDQGTEMLARVRNNQPHVNHDGLASRIAAEESALSRLIEEMHYYPPQSA